MAEIDSHTPQSAVDIIIPVLNETEALAAFHESLCQTIDSLQHFCFHLIYVDDGSKDDTLQKLKQIAAHDTRVTILELSRNFGHQAAITAGMDIATGDYVITMDGDGQHPPDLIPQMLVLAQDGFDIVITQRIDEGNISFFKRSTSRLFYRLINRIADTHIQPGAADYRLLSRPVVEALSDMREYHRFLRGMVGWMGYRTVILPYKQPLRMAGQSKFSLKKMLQLSLNAVFSFSLVPLYMVLSLGGVFLLLAVLEVLYVVCLWLFFPEKLVHGWSSLMFILLMVGGTLMVSLGFIGIYVGYIFQEVKQRPLYLVRKVWQGAEEKKRPQGEDDDVNNFPSIEK